MLATGYQAKDWVLGPQDNRSSEFVYSLGGTGTNRTAMWYGQYASSTESQVLGGSEEKGRSKREGTSSVLFIRLFSP